MRGAKRCHALPAIFFLLLTSAPAPPGVEGSSRDLEAPGGDRRTLLDLLLQAMGDSQSHQPHHPPRGDRVIARRYSGSALYSAAVDQEPRVTSSASASRERAAGQVPRIFTSSRHVEIFPRDSNLKDKFIKHFTGIHRSVSEDCVSSRRMLEQGDLYTRPVSFSAECSKHFHRLYHNTRDCSTPAYYKRCARLLTRLAMSPLCTQP
ncbi:ALK and LTK ligand 1 isoform X1 [Mauremys reevesii]|uniref:ALK and LTK ligand 1 isoform X1 n=1 Tax=Mauremys reevesii TaxID=260615 RepID=UPI00193F55F7|nr:ALK and LTK ligand 1 isoform X1 [Mauremys reevesii]